jgi:nucleoside-diphosphate-sugar epimerase
VVYKLSEGNEDLLQGHLVKKMTSNVNQKTGILIGGSGLIGGTLMHHFKSIDYAKVNLLAPNSKKLSLRVPDDIRAYFERTKPDFIINCAIASLDSDPQLACEINYMGTVYLARAARELGIPYIHISSAATMPSGKDLTEASRLSLTAALPNYAKGKLMAEQTLEHMHRTKGLDYTNIRLAVVYGAHDHKIQGFHRLLFSIANRAMPVLLTSRNSVHSYTNANKLPDFVAHVLANRGEFSGETYNFVDPEPVALAQLILAIKSMLGLKNPRKIYVPYTLAKLSIAVLDRLVSMVSHIGIEARLPAEILFLEKFYESQTLSAAKLKNSSFADPDPESDIFSELPRLLKYYISRWELLNLIERSGRFHIDRQENAEEFHRSPEKLFNAVLAEQETPFLQQCALVNSMLHNRRSTDQEK